MIVFYARKFDMNKDSNVMDRDYKLALINLGRKLCIGTELNA